MIELVLSKVMLVLFISLPLLWLIQLFRLGFSNLKANWQKILIVMLLWLAGGFWLALETLFGKTLILASIAIATLVAGVVLLMLLKTSIGEQFDNEKTSKNHRLRHWSRSWMIVLVINTLIFWVLERELGSRGPLEVTIEVDEPDKKDFVVSTIFYIGGHVSYSAYQYKTIVAAGESVKFPRSYVMFHYFQDWLYPELTKADIEIAVYHPEYETPREAVYLKYAFPHRTTHKTIHLTHWDTKFEQMEEKVKLQPDRALEFRFKMYEKFRYGIGGLKDSWVPVFGEHQEKQLKDKYLPWIESKRRDYSEYWNCSSLSDCIRQHKKGNLREYKPRSFPFK